MTFTEFLIYLEKNLSGYDLFLIKAEEYQIEKNKKRKPDKRWNENKIRRTVDNMWKTSMEVGYDNLKATIKKKGLDPYQTWINYFESNNILDAINDSISELEFE